jgi:hypothetical protein
LNIVIYNIIPKLENNYSLLVSPIIFPETIIDINKKRIQPIANYIKPTKSNKPKENNIN